MKRNSILLCILLAITANFITPAAKAQVNTTDSLALVDLYNSTDGSHWKHNTNWLTTAPVSTWYGIKVTGYRVVKVNLYDNNLNGTIPASIGNLTMLTLLELTGQLTGTIPSTLGNLVNLTDLVLAFNKLTGTIPAEFGNLVNLTELNLETNQLTGTIPSTLGNCTNLNDLIIENNQFTGTIPATLGNLRKLTDLDVSINQLSGAIPAEIGNCKNLNDLILNNNQLTGAIPAELGKLTKLTLLTFSYNQLTGAIPSSLGNLKNLNYLLLFENQLSGAIPATLAKLKDCFMNFEDNQLSGFGHYNPAKDTNYPVALYIDANLFTFDGIEQVVKKDRQIQYAPQNTILPIHQNGNTLSVYAGGTLNRNTYRWHKASSIGSTTIDGDSTFTPAESGMYYVTVNNDIARKLTLYSDTINYVMPAAKQSNSLIAKATTPSIVTSHMQVYPNPASNSIHIQASGAAELILINSAGKTLLTKTINNSDVINLSQLANGTYYIQNKTTGEVQKVVVVH